MLHLINYHRGWWGEGDEKIYVDGEDFPSHFGTGTEDYYGYAWCRPEEFAERGLSQRLQREVFAADRGTIFDRDGRELAVTVDATTVYANPLEIAYFDRGPIHEDHLILGGYWSTYWYKGKIYGTEIARGLDVLALVPSEHLTTNEIAELMGLKQGAVLTRLHRARLKLREDIVD